MSTVPSYEDLGRAGSAGEEMSSKERQVKHHSTKNWKSWGAESV